MTAYAPRVLLKVVLFAYSRGIVSSRDIEQACRENVTFMALSGDNAPHFTTVASFIRELKDEIANLFTQVLFLCNAQGLIGREMFAIDGVKLPSNASKAKSGSRSEFAREAAKIEAQIHSMLERHRETDARPLEPGLAERETKRIARLSQDAAQLRQWLTDNPEARRAGREIDRLKSWALEVQGRTNHNKAACALANRLARIAWAVWVKQETYRGQALAAAQSSLCSA